MFCMFKMIKTMLRRIKKIFTKSDYRSNRDIAPDEIFLDSKNLPDLYDVYQIEGP